MLNGAKKDKVQSLFIRQLFLLLTSFNLGFNLSQSHFTYEILFKRSF